MGAMIPQESGTEFLGNREFWKTGVQESREPKKRVHNLAVEGRAAWLMLVVAYRIVDKTTYV